MKLSATVKEAVADVQAEISQEEAAQAGLSPELAAGIRRVKGVRRIGVRLGNWLTPEQGAQGGRRR